MPSSTGQDTDLLDFILNTFLHVHFLL